MDNEKAPDSKGEHGSDNTVCKVVDILIERKMKISFAESCTGGLCCGELVGVTSVSNVLDESFVTYANEAKVELLGVKQESIDKYGVVSEQVAAEMATGVANKAKSSVGVGITGIAGPTGATENKPIGMVCFGFSINGVVKTYTMQFGTIGRNNVRRASVDFVYSKLYELLN